MFTRNDDIRNQIWEAVSGLEEEQLNQKPSPAQWSIMQVLRHLNLMENVIGKQARLALEKEQTVSVDKKHMNYRWTAAAPSRHHPIFSRQQRLKHLQMYAVIWTNLTKR